MNNEPSETVFEVNERLVDTNVHFIGDKQTISQIVLLLAYIRHAVKNNLNTDIKISIGKHIVNRELAFDVNNQEIADYITQKTLEIN